MAIQLVKTNKEDDNFERKTIGYDIKHERINELKRGFDSTNEIEKNDLNFLEEITLTSDVNKLTDADVFIVTVPTPIDINNLPNLDPLINACKEIGNVVKTRNIIKKEIASVIIFESTVYPGTTEEICVPIIEEESGLYLNNEFYCGYSPERINPGDKPHRLPNIVKVTSGSDDKSSDWIDNFYNAFITAGTHNTRSIKVAEAAKIIENTQRDLNIALINELSVIFKRMNLDTLDVLEAASTKWNFLSFKPGLVGGHCIGVDPYYLTYKAEELGYTPKVILSGRKLNDGMASWVAQEMITMIKVKNEKLENLNILIIGFTFKVNCPDIRNTQIIKFVRTLENDEHNFKVDIFDNLANQEDVMKTYSLKLLKNIPKNKKYIGIVVAVPHSTLKELIRFDLQNLIEDNGVIIDLHGSVPRELNPWRI